MSRWFYGGIHVIVEKSHSTREMRFVDVFNVEQWSVDARIVEQ